MKLNFLEGLSLIITSGIKHVLIVDFDSDMDQCYWLRFCKDSFLIQGKKCEIIHFNYLPWSLCAFLFLMNVSDW